MNLPETINTNFSTVPSYNLVCHLIPGILFAYILEQVVSISIVPQPVTGINIVYAATIIFVSGIFVNRFGSLIMERVSKNLKPGGRTKTDYKNYVIALKNDSTIERLMIMKELYKSLISVSVLVPAIWIFKVLYTESKTFAEVLPLIVYASIILFLLNTYYRTSRYIDQRVEVFSIDEQDVK